MGTSLRFAHLKHSGAGPSDVVNTRAIVSFTWVAAPPLATLIMGTLGNRAVLLAIAVIAILNMGTTAAMIARRPPANASPMVQTGPGDGGVPVSKGRVAVVVLGFIALQASNSAAVSFMGLGLDVVWAGAALGTRSRRCC